MCAMFINLGKVLNRSKSGRLSGAWRGLWKGVENLRGWWCSIVDCWCEQYFLMDTQRMWSETDRSNDAGPWRCVRRRVVQKLADGLPDKRQVAYMRLPCGWRLWAQDVSSVAVACVWTWTPLALDGPQQWNRVVARGARVRPSLRPNMQQWGESGSCCLELQRIVLLGRANCDSVAEALAFPVREWILALVSSQSLLLRQRSWPCQVNEKEMCLPVILLKRSRHERRRTKKYPSSKTTEKWKEQTEKAEDKEEEKDRWWNQTTSHSGSVPQTTTTTR